MILLSGDWNSRIHQMVLFIQQKFSSSEVLRTIHTQIKDTVFSHAVTSLPGRLIAFVADEPFHKVYAYISGGQPLFKGTPPS